MIHIPHAARCFAIALVALALCLAGENTIISADVLSSQSGASALSSAAIAVACTGIEIAFCSWLFQGRSGPEILSQLKKAKGPTLMRIGVGTAVLCAVYDFDIRTTYMHPQFQNADAYFFVAVVGAYVFGPEILLNVGWWLWNRAQQEETKYMAATNHRAAENAYRKEERAQSIALAKEAGRAHATEKAKNRWGPGSVSDTRTMV